MLENTKTVQLALYRHIQYNWDTVREFPSSSLEYAQVSLPIDVQFHIRSEAEILQEKLKCMDNAIADLFEKIEEIRGEKQSLLALESNVQTEE